MVFSKVFSPESIILDLESTDKDQLFEEMVDALHAARPDFDRSEALASLRERESMMSTGIMHSIAVPHGSIGSLEGSIGAVGICRGGMEYGSLDGAPVHLVFMLLCGKGETELHLEVLKALALVLQHRDFVQELMSKTSRKEIFDLLCEAES
ncbi:MAG: PTS sugar transporter subunit IIA [Treponema sp.]|nr:PTS sugar transporter subunit IIA [Treponema sp.]